MVDTLLLPARLFLIFTFFLSGFTKLHDRDAFQKTLTDFGAPQRLIASLHVFFVGAEFIAALALLGARTFWWGALVALLLLLLFSIAVGANLLRGRTPSCHCFGQLSGGEISWRTLVRNGALATIAAFIVRRGPQQDAAGILDVLRTAGATIPLSNLLPMVVAFVLFVVQGWFIIHLLRQNGRLLLRIEALEARLGNTGLRQMSPPPNNHRRQGLDVGLRAPTFRLLLSGSSQRLSLDMLLAHERPVLLIFVDPDCGSCRQMFPEIARWQKVHASRLTIALIGRVTRNGNGNMKPEPIVQNMLLQEKHEVAEAYHVHATPSAVLLRPDGVIASPMVAGPDAIRNLLQQAVRDAVLGAQPSGASRIRL